MPAQTMKEADEVQPATGGGCSRAPDRLASSVQYAIPAEKILETGAESGGGDDDVEGLARPVREHRLGLGESREGRPNPHHFAFDRAHEPDVDQRHSLRRERAPARARDVVPSEI